MNYCLMCSSGCHYCETKKDMKFKNGDKVRVVDDSCTPHYKKGDEVTIRRYCNDDTYECSSPFGKTQWFSPERLELITKTNKMDLKDLQKKYEELGKEIEALKCNQEGVDLSRFEFNGLGSNVFLKVRSFGGLAGRCFYLGGNHSWEIREDVDGDLLLIPTKKK